ncbi:hypothetical protein [Dankookia sp. P2]|uniref:hypothetical protein n=1 Tax=Dankookia sp. P2 TaxID=3423955 RepID=UPI003D6703E2
MPWHRALARLRFTSFEAVAAERFDLALATWWKTIYELHRIDAGRYAYFVQSIESWFYPDSDAAVRNLVNATYLLPLPGITEARWIRDHLRSRFGHDYHLVPNGCSKALYAAAGRLHRTARARPATDPGGRPARRRLQECGAEHCPRAAGRDR